MTDKLLNIRFNSNISVKDALDKMIKYISFNYNTNKTKFKCYNKDFIELKCEEGVTKRYKYKLTKLSRTHFYCEIIDVITLSDKKIN